MEAPLPSWFGNRSEGPCVRRPDEGGKAWWGRGSWVTGWKTEGERDDPHRDFPPCSTSSRERYREVIKAISAPAH